MARPLSRFVTFAAAALASVLASVAVSVPAYAAGIDYVALGDSYSSGVGASGATGSCKRSERAYGALWATANDVASFRLAACSGATTNDVVSDQLSSLSDETDLVSITIGGNDAGFASTASSCVLGSDADCVAAVAKARTYAADTLPGRLDTTYAAIAEKAPNATVVVLGYPYLFETTATCGGGGLSLAKRRAMNAATDDLAATISSRAGAARFRYTDVRDDFSGHGVCGLVQWIHPVDLFNVGQSFHPTSSGYADGYLPAFAAAVS